MGNITAQQEYPNSIKVLDNGSIDLVSYMGSDLSIVKAARVSLGFDMENMPQNRDKGLIRYMLENRHTSPFEHVVFTFMIKAPIFVIRQWHRHRTWSYNEISGRYVEFDENDYYVPNDLFINVQSKSNKQGRDEGVVLEAEKKRDIRHNYILACNAAFDYYEDLLELGLAREVARCVLPLSLYSRFYATVDLHNLLHFLGLRLENHAQKEIREYAKALLSLIMPIVPITLDIWLSKLNPSEYDLPELPYLIPPNQIQGQ